MSAQHTPGPWEWDESGYTLRASKPDPQRHAVHTILEVENWSYGFLGAPLAAALAESEGNKRLITAAPELLAALVALLNDQYRMGQTVAMARTAIAKATGSAA